MINRILPLLNRLLPAGIAFKGLSKVNPKVGKYLTAVTQAGYTADEAMDYLRNQLGVNEDQQGLRPDEKAANARVSQSKQIPGSIKKAGEIALGATQIGLAGKALPSVIGNMFDQENGNQQNQNIIQNYSPELSQFIEQHIQSGRSPIEAGALAQLNPKFRSAISKMEQDNKTQFSQILESIYGQGQQGNQQNQRMQQNDISQNGNADQALLAALDKILKM